MTEVSGITDRYAEATAWKQIEPGHCALCGQRPEVKPKTIAEFCAWWRMSRHKFYELRARGQAPAMIKVGAVILITRDAEEAWKRKLASITDADEVSQAVSTCSNV